MRKTVLFLIFSITSFASISLFAQKITVNAKIDSTMIWIGNQAHLTYEVSQQPNQKVIMPIFTDSIPGGLELVEPGKMDTSKSPDGHLVVSQHYLVTAFKDSLLYIPAFPFVLNGDTVWSKSLSLKVVQPFKIDTASKKIADIKPVYDMRFDWRDFLKTVLLILVILILIGALIYLFQRYFKKKPVLTENEIKLLQPAHVVALNQLDKIKQEKLWQQGRSKEYHTELTDVLREYIERMFNINSMEMTSEEILEHLRALRMEQKSTYMSLQQILKLADLVKFAKWNAAPDEHELSLVNAYLFVNQTKVEEVKPIDEIKNEETTEV
ncbi:MAG: hypothetical protein WCK78_16020 [Paludibacter sp.]